MNYLVGLSVLASIVVLNAEAGNLDDLQSFESYATKHGLSRGEAEYNTRKTIFEDQIHQINDHNSIESSWSETANKFSGMTANERKLFLGGLKSKTTLSERQLPSDFILDSVGSLPKHVDWRSKGPLKLGIFSSQHLP